MKPVSWRERPLVFSCEGSRLVGLVAVPETPAETGVVIIVGGPQYRAGSHRQFTLLARRLAGHGIASLRFDYRGMGDSEGDARNFESIDVDIKAAVDVLLAEVPGVRRVVLWGLCDAASAALYFGHQDARVQGMILLNPWVHTEAVAARARLRHYYLDRLLQKAFWAKLTAGRFSIRKSLRDLFAMLATLSGRGNAAPADPRHGGDDFVDRMLAGLDQFKGEVLVILSGNDLTAQEFGQLLGTDKKWKSAFSSSRRRMVEVPQANHTFSSAAWRGQVESLTTGWICKEESQ